MKSRSQVFRLGLITLGLCIVLSALAFWGLRYFLHTAPTPNFPLQITSITISPEPKVGVPAILHIEFSSYKDEKDVLLTIRLSEGIKQMGGNLEWRGSLQANQVQFHDVPICIVYEGYWEVKSGVVSYLSVDSVYGDDKSLFVKSSRISAEFFDHFATQPPGGYTQPTVLPLLPTDICQ